MKKLFFISAAMLVVSCFSFKKIGGFLIPQTSTYTSVFAPNEGETPLHKAAQRGNVKEIKALIAAGADIEVKDKFEFTPLHKAVISDQSEAIKILIAAGANVNIERCIPSGTPIDYANLSNNVDAAASFKDADIMIGCAITPLNFFAEKNQTEFIKALIAASADVNIKGCFSVTPLHWAVYNGNAEAIKVLIEKGANTEAKDDAGKTPLHIAAFMRNTEIIKLLLKKGADKEAKG